MAEVSGELNAQVPCFIFAGDNGRDSSTTYRYFIQGGNAGAGTDVAFALYFYPGELAARSYSWNDHRFGAALQVVDTRNSSRIWSSESASLVAISPPPAFSLVLTGLEEEPIVPPPADGKTKNYLLHGHLDAILPPYFLHGTPPDAGAHDNLTVHMTF